MTGKSMSDNEVSEKRVNVLEDLVKQLVDKVKVLEDILKKKEKDAKDINHKIDETLPKDMPGKRFECDNCDDNFKSRKTLEQHRENHQTNKKKVTGKVCHECKKTFELNVDLEIHMKSHKKTKMFKCKLCDKTFHLKWRLTNTPQDMKPK
jgi:hypothetical protein